MSILENQETFRNKLDQLPPKLRVAFAVDCAAHALPRYEDWTRNEGKNWGNPERLKQAIDLIWNAVETDTVTAQELEKELEAIESLVPDTEIFPRVSGNGALDAGIAVLESIDCAKTNGDVDHALSASKAACLAADVLSDEFIASLRNMTQSQIRDRGERDSALLIEEWERQLNTLDKLIHWKHPQITREQLGLL